MTEDRRFRTVQEIMEYYIPDWPMLGTGKEIGKRLAEKLLAEFRQKIADD